MRKSTASCESLALFILGIKAFSERNFHFNLHLMVLNICLWRWRFESVANIGQIVPRHFINHRNTRVISTLQKILDLINTCYMSSSKFYWINKDSINWKSFDSSKGKSFFKKVIPNSGGDGRHKGAPSRGRCGACWDAGADKTDQDLLTITNGAFLFSVYYYTLIQFLCNL